MNEQIAVFPYFDHRINRSRVPGDNNSATIRCELIPQCDPSVRMIDLKCLNSDILVLVAIARPDFVGYGSISFRITWFQAAYANLPIHFVSREDVIGHTSKARGTIDIDRL